MKTTKILLFSLGLTGLLTACGPDKDENPAGTWTDAAPVPVTVVDATTATRTATFDFADQGRLTYSADYSVSTPDTAYSVTATIEGTWTAQKGEDDDYLLSFDQNTLQVQGTDAPELGPVTDAFISSLATYTTIEDVKVTHDGTHMTFETKSPKAKYHFVRK